MGLCGLAALAFLGYSLYAQSPRVRARSATEPYKFDLRVRQLTALSFASLLLLMGFFLAGVPTQALVDAELDASPAVVTASVEPAAEIDALAEADALAEVATSTPTRSGSGAFNGPPPDNGAAASAVAVSDASGVTGEEVEATETRDSAEATGETPEPESEPELEPSATPAPTQTPEDDPTPTPTRTPTPSPTPTVTPRPTLTPTPVEDPTGSISTGGGTLWVRQSPGGPNIALVRDGEMVILRGGHASQAGILWHEVMTLDGVTGWVQDEFLAVDA